MSPKTCSVEYLNGAGDFETVLGVVTTVMNALGTKRTQTQARKLGRYHSYLQSETRNDALTGVTE